MTRFTRREAMSLAAALALTAGSARSAERWIEGRHYFKVAQPQSTAQLAATATVTEIFSYGCSGCNGFLPYMQGLEKRLPADVPVDYLPASWIASENWPAFQRAYLTASALGVDKKAHDAMFAAVWRTGELAIADPRTGRPKSPLPSMQDIARFYERTTAVPAAKFLETSRSFAVDSGIKRADAAIKAFRAESTPTIIINGTYRADLRSTGSADQLVALSLWLAQREQRP